MNLFLVSAMAYYGVEITNKNQSLENQQSINTFFPETTLPETLSTDSLPRPAEQTLNENQHKIIITRNLFKVETQKAIDQEPEETEVNAPELLEPTTLKLVLWGTVTGNAEVFAVIEDKQLRQQALYQVGDSVQGANLKKILRNQVILSYEGKNQVLEMETDDKMASKPELPLKEFNSRPDDAAGSDDFPSNLIDTLGRAMKQIRFRPHFTEGEPDGLMVYGIRPNSVFMKVGLRNGDIVKEINGTPIVSTEDHTQLFDEIENAETAKLTVFRRGKEQELFYEAKGDDPFVEALPGNREEGDDE